MTLPRKVGFFGLRREFNYAVAALEGLMVSVAKLLKNVLEVDQRLQVLEERAAMHDTLDGFQARYDAFVLEKEEEETDDDTKERTED